MIDKINVRVYGLCIQDRKILALHEMYAGQALTKFPGGGLEFGEGLTDCLQREFLEELNVRIENIRHFYTQEDFLKSRFRKNEQLLIIYYLCDIIRGEQLEIMPSSIEKTEWIPLHNEENPFPLPIDRLVFDKLKLQYC